MLDDLPELRLLRLLHGLSLEQIEGFLSYCTESDVDEDALLMEEGEEDQGMVVVLEGALEVFTERHGELMAIRRVQVGEHVGALSALGLVRRRTASVRALRRSRVLVIERAGLDALQRASNPAFDNIEVDVLRELAHMIRETDRHVARLAVGRHPEPEAPKGMLGRLKADLVGDGPPPGRGPSLVEVLAGSPFFPEVEEELAERLERFVTAVAFGVGDHLVDEGGDVDCAYLLASGRIGVYREVSEGRHERIGQLEPGALFGHVALIDGETRTADCVGEQAGWAFRIPKGLIYEFVNRHEPEARVMRMGFIRALLAQLAQADHTLRRVATERGKLEQEADGGFYWEKDLDPARAALVGPI